MDVVVMDRASKALWAPRQAFMWAFKLFRISVGLTVGLWLALFVLSTLVFSSPEPVASTTTGVVSLVMERVVGLEEWVGLWMALFALNTCAAVVASTSSALLLLLLPLQVPDIQSRMAHPRYERFAKILDKLIYVLWTPCFHVFKRFDRGFAQRYEVDPPSSQFQGFWRLCGYSGIGFRNIFYVFPFVIPALTAIINGGLIGMVLAVNLAMGAYAGFLAAGVPGLAIGSFLNVLYFLSAILPHGILEVFAVFMAIAVGQGFAALYSNEIFERGLLIDHRLEAFDKDLKYLVTVTKQFLMSRRVLTTLAVIVGLLFLSAYIEAHITPTIVANVLTILREIWVTSLG
jgi:uncharacterized membrane protein SpoIIM required for sporulation